MSVRETYVTWREASAARPFLYNSTRPVSSLCLAVFAYVGAAYALAIIVALAVGSTSATVDLFAKPYFALLAAWIAACSWFGERRNWRKYVDERATEIMIGPVDEIGEQK